MFFASIEHGVVDLRYRLKLVKIRYEPVYIAVALRAAELLVLVLIDKVKHRRREFRTLQLLPDIIPRRLIFRAESDAVGK